MLATYFRWKIPMDDALALSFIVFLVLEPGAIYQVGFQLSYLATYSLVYSSRILARYVKFLGTIIFYYLCLSTPCVSFITASLF